MPPPASKKRKTTSKKPVAPDSNDGESEVDDDDHLGPSPAPSSSSTRPEPSRRPSRAPAHDGGEKIGLGTGPGDVNEPGITVSVSGLVPRFAAGPPYPFASR